MMRYARALVWPLWGRLLQGEGGLWLVASSLVLVDGLGLFDAAARVVLLGILLWTLYLFNDLTDRIADRDNPRKDQSVVQAYGDAIRGYWGVWAGSSLVCLLVIQSHASESALWALGVMLINIAYSYRFKALPWVDVATVGLWGSTYTAVASRDRGLCMVVGCMTMIAHVYQTRTDQKVDRAQGVTTIAVHAPRAAQALVSCLAAVMAGAVHMAGGSPAAVVLAVAVAVPIWFFASNQWAWHGSRLMFGACWLALIGPRVTA